MAVFTTLSQKELEKVLKDFKLGELREINAIAQGTVNSNYELKTSQGHFVLTVLESMDASLANQLLCFIEFCAQQGFPCPFPIKAAPNQWLIPLQKKRITICAFLPGTMVSDPSPSLCFQMGKTLAQLHLAGQEYPDKPINQMGFDWQQKAYLNLQKILTPDEHKVLQAALMGQKSIARNNCPKGMIHFDCFMDNVLTQDNKITGILDFYYACFDYFILDIAVTLNDWCYNQAKSNLNFDDCMTFIEGYQTIRSLTFAEWESLQDALTLMAAHFWMSRKLTQLENKKGFGDFNRDPSPFKRLCLNHQSSSLVDDIKNALQY